MREIFRSKQGESIHPLILLLWGFFILFFQIPSEAAAPSDASKLIPKPVTPVKACSFSFSDSYYQVGTATPPTVAGIQYGSGGVYYSISNIDNAPFGPPLALKFNSNPTGNTPPLPCDGYYSVTFSIVTRNNSGQGCNRGQNTLSVAVTSTDPTMTNVYGCPVRYGNFCCAYGYPSCCSWTNSMVSGTSMIQSCGKTTQWIQCTWGTNYNNALYWDIGNYYKVSGYPIFSYTPYWTYQSGRNFSPVYPGQCYGGSNCYTGSYYQGMADTPHTAYCAQKPLYFKKIVYLHKGATISPPTIWSQISAMSIYYMTSAFQTWSCGMSVTGGSFSVNYLHP